MTCVKLQFSLCKAMKTFEEELFDPHFLLDAVPNTDVNSAMLRKQKFLVAGNNNTVAKKQSYGQTRNFQECDNFVGTLNERNKMEVMCDLLCRPVSVNVVKLSAKEIQRWTKSKARNSQLQNSLMHHRKKRRNRKKIYQRIKRITKSRNDNKRHSKYSNKVRNAQHLKRQESVSKGVDINNLMKNVKQPFIKIRRIDEVINKIAKSFAKVIPDKECEKNENAKIDTTNAIANSIVNEIPQLNESTQCTDTNLEDEIVHKSKRRQKLRKRNIIYDSDSSSSDDNVNKRRQSLRKRNIIYNSESSSDDNENNNVKKIILRKHKRQKSDFPEKREESCIRNQNYNSIEAKYIDRKQRLQSCPQLNVAAKISDLSDNKDLSVKKNVNVSQQSSDTLNMNETLKFQHSNNNASIRVSSKLSTTEDNISGEAQDGDIVATEKIISENEKLEEPMEKSIHSDKYLIEKHKLCKELKVRLIKFDFIRTFIENKYSATEIEQLTNVYMNFILNSNFSKTIQSTSVTCTTLKIEETSENHLGRVTSDKTSSEDFNVNLGKRDRLNATDLEEVQILNSCQDLESNTPSTGVQNIVPSSEISKNSPILRKMLHKRKNLHIENDCIILTEHLKENSNERSEQDTIINLVQKRTPGKSSKLLNLAEDTGDIEKTKDIFYTNSKKMPSVDESILKILSSKECSIENFAKRTKKTADGSSNVTDLHLLPSVQNETVPGSEGRLCIIKSHKSAQCIPKSDSSFMIASANHKKSIHRTDNKSAVYKCIVCDNCFENYSGLQDHLVVHTQKCNSASNAPEEIITLSEDLNQVGPDSSELETFGSAQCSAQNNNNKQLIHESGMGSKDKQKNGKDVIKASRNKDNKSKSVQDVAVSNTSECNICSQQFPTETDLTAHIYLHTESELQEMFKQSNQKTKHVNKRAEEIETTQIKTAGKIVDIGYNTVGSITHPNMDETKSQKSAISNEKDSEGKESRSQTIVKEQKVNKVDDSKSIFAICGCHNQPETNKNCLKIEIVYLCNTCRVLFRSMECLETHYRLPKHVVCNENRLNRSPYLLCATCHILFTSVQETRHHLEIHACLKQNCTMDIQCNICKVTFIGIGTLFYKHWWKHKKGKSYIASVQSFPKRNVVIQKFKKVDKYGKLFTVTSNRSPEGYLKIAEYVCKNCKLPFLTNDDLRKHTLPCISDTLDTNATVSENSYVNTHKSLSVKVVCSLCKDHLLPEKTEFYKHIMNKHNFSGELQFVCISLTGQPRSFICSICMEIAKTLDDFQDHWLVHSTRDIVFACACGKTYYNSLNAFLEHANYHKSKNKEDILIYCIVSYRDKKIICTHCNVGFKSSNSYNEHMHSHKLNCGEKNSNEDETPNRASSALQSVKSGTLEKLKDLTDEKECSNTECFAKYGTDRDKEKLIRILEGSDDSEPELIIDLQEEFADRDEPLVTKEIEQIPSTLNYVSVAGTETLPRKEILPTATDSQTSQNKESLPATVNAQTPLKEGTSPTIASTSSSEEDICILPVSYAATASTQTISNEKNFTTKTETLGEETLSTTTNVSVTNHRTCEQNVTVTETSTASPLEDGEVCILAVSSAPTAKTQTVSNSETFKTNTPTPSDEKTSPTTINASITDHPTCQQNVTVTDTATASPLEDGEEVCILAVSSAPTASIQTVSNSKLFTTNTQISLDEKILPTTINASITDHTCQQNITVSETITAISCTGSTQTVSSGESLTIKTQIPSDEETSPTITNTSVTDHPTCQQNVTVTETSTASPLEDGEEVCILAVSSAPTASKQTVSSKETFTTNTQTPSDEKTSPTTINASITDHPTCQQNVTVTETATPFPEEDGEEVCILAVSSAPTSSTQTVSNRETVITNTQTPSGKKSLPTTTNASDITDHTICKQNVTITETTTASMLPQNIPVTTSSQITALGTSEQPNMRLAENVQSNEVHDTVSVTNQDKPTDLENVVPINVQCLPKQQVGFLRVKTMAELTGCVPDLQTPPVSQTKLLLRLLKTGTSSTDSSTLHKQDYIVSNNVKKLALTRVNKEAVQHLQANVTRNKRSAVENVISGSHKNLPSCNIARTVLPHATPLQDSMKPTKKSSEFNVQNVQKQWAKSFYLDKNNDTEYKYKCKFCNYRGKTLAESLMHELPGTQNACKSQRMQHSNVNDQGPVIHVDQGLPTFPTITTANEVYDDKVQNNVTAEQCESTIPYDPRILYTLPMMVAANKVQNNASLEQCQPITTSQPSIEYASSSVYSQYPHFGTSSSNTSNQIFQQDRPIILNQSVTGSASRPLYYKNSNASNDDMSIVINQGAPIVQNIPTINISEPSEQQVYQSSVYRTKPMTLMKTPYIQQPQNLVDFSASNDVYQMANNSCNVPPEDTTIGNCNVRLQVPTFACVYCPKMVSFVSQEVLEIHMNLCHNFVCDICNSLLYNMHDLNVHKMQHSYM